VDECFEDAHRFEQAIAKKKIKNFASCAVATKVKGEDAKLVVPPR